MPAIFHVDQARTFQMVMFLSSAPKMVFGSNDKQDTTKDGLPKWEVQVVASFIAFGGKLENEILKIGVASYQDPAAALGGPQPVHLNGFRVGVSPAEKRTDRNGNEKIVGGTAWYQADEIVSVNAVPASRAAKAEA